MYKYVIFDFDGTITDTSEGIVKSFAYSFTQMGREVPDLSDRNKFIGPPLDYSYVEFYGVSKEEAAVYLAKYRERYSTKGIYECCLYDGITELLARLKDKGIKMGIASSKPEKFVNQVAEFLGVRKFFDVTVGIGIGEKVHPTKKELILTAMERLGAENKEDCLMVGDRFYDIDGARQAGVKSCGVLWGFGSEKELCDHGADFIASSPKKIAEIVL